MRNARVETRPEKTRYNIQETRMTSEKEDGTYFGSWSQDQMCGEEVDLLDRTILTTLHVLNVKSR